MPTIEDNLTLARGAVLYARLQFPRGAENKFEDVIRAGGGSVQKQRDTGGALAKQLGGDSVDFAMMFARAFGRGNCGEHSMEAYRYLTRQPGVINLAMLVMNGWNHQFVVLGAAKLNGRRQISLSKNAAPDLGKFAVVCDPWIGDSFAVSTHWIDWIKLILSRTLRPGSTPPSTCIAEVIEYQHIPGRPSIRRAGQQGE